MALNDPLSIYFSFSTIHSVSLRGPSRPHPFIILRLDSTRTLLQPLLYLPHPSAPTRLVFQPPILSQFSRVSYIPLSLSFSDTAAYVPLFYPDPTPPPLPPHSLSWFSFSQRPLGNLICISSMSFPSPPHRLYLRYMFLSLCGPV